MVLVVVVVVVIYLCVVLLSTAGHCLARKMFTTWRQEEAAGNQPYLTE